MSLSLSADLATHMHFRNGTTGEWTDWEPYNTTKQLYLAGSSHNKIYSIYVEFQNKGGKTDPIYDSIRYIESVPLNPSILINNGDNSTDSVLVTLTLSAERADEMCFRNGTDGTWSTWESYSTTKQLYLAGSTNNTLYSISVKFCNLAGQSGEVSDDILLLLEGDGDGGDGDGDDGDGTSGPPIMMIIIISSAIGGVVVTATVIALILKKRKA